MDAKSVDVKDVLVIQWHDALFTVDRQEALRWFGEKGPRLLDWREEVDFRASVRPISRRPIGAFEEHVFSIALLERGAEVVKIY